MRLNGHIIRRISASALFRQRGKCNGAHIPRGGGFGGANDFHFFSKGWSLPLLQERATVHVARHTRSIYSVGRASGDEGLKAKVLSVALIVGVLSVSLAPKAGALQATTAVPQQISGGTFNLYIYPSSPLGASTTPAEDTPVFGISASTGVTVTAPETIPGYEFLWWAADPNSASQSPCDYEYDSGATLNPTWHFTCANPGNNTVANIQAVYQVCGTSCPSVTSSGSSSGTYSIYLYPSSFPSTSGYPNPPEYTGYSLTTAPIQEGQALIGIPVAQIVTISTPNPYGTFDYWTAAAGSTCDLQIITPTTGSTWSFACTNPNSVLNIEAVYSEPHPTTCAANAVCANAYSQLGVRYVNGGKTPYVGFDCSGLVQWAAFAAGLNMPGDDTVTQWDGLSAAGAIIPQSSTLPGDLVYFNEPGQSNPAHVGVCDNVGCSLMIDAPHTGAVVRIESVAWFAPVEGYARIPGNN